MVHSACTYRDIFPLYTPEELEGFHGHLGPFLVLGYRIGRMARQKVTANPFLMEAIIHIPEESPEICIADGVQLGSGCTLGKGNIRIVIDPDVRCEFVSGARRLVVRYRPFDRPVRDEDYEKHLRKYALRFFEAPEEDILTWDLSGASPPDPADAKED